jgi:hypothetical protein
MLDLSEMCILGRGLNALDSEIDYKELERSFKEDN